MICSSSMAREAYARIEEVFSSFQVEPVGGAGAKTVSSIFESICVWKHVAVYLHSPNCE